MQRSSAGKKCLSKKNYSSPSALLTNLVKTVINCANIIKNGWKNWANKIKKIKKNCRVQPILVQENALYTELCQKLMHFCVFLDIYERRTIQILLHILDMFVK